MDSLDSKSGLEKQIESHVDKTGALITGEFDEASERGLAKYVYSVHRSVEHLESLCSPIVDDQYLDKAPDSASSIDSKIENKQFNSILTKSDEKFRYLTNLLYRRGIL